MPVQPTEKAAPAVVALPAMDHLSWSSISSYRACPRRFAYAYIEHAPAERRSAALPFGSAVHRAVEILHQARLEGVKLPGLTDLTAAYEDSWKKETAEGPVLAFGKAEDPKTLNAMAERMLAAYRQHVAESVTAGQLLAIEHSERFRIVAEAPPLEARLDRVELDGETLIVTDTKTSKTRWNDTKILESRPQVVLYGFAMIGMRNALGAKRILARFEVLTKHKKPVVQVLEPQITRDDALRVRELVGETWRAIQAGVFPRRESYSCDQCPFRVRCLGR